MVRYLGDRDSTTRTLLERILTQEEEHANDMHDLLVSHEGRPMLDEQAGERRWRCTTRQGWRAIHGIVIPPETHARPASGQAARSLHFGAFDPLGAFVRRGLERAVLADPALAAVPDAARWAADVREQAWSVYRSHEAGYDAAGRAHLRTAAHVLAMYRALAGPVDARPAIDLLGRALTDAYRPLFRGPVPLVLRVLRRPVRTIARLGGNRFLQRRLFGAAFAIGTFEGGGVVELRVDRCLYHRFFATCGAPELTAVICLSDAAWVDALPTTGATVGFERPQTLGWGGAQCVFRFTARSAPRSGGLE